MQKGEQQGDADLLEREPQDTRPLSLKNADSKLIAGANVHALREVQRRWTIWCQRGFTPGRQLTLNILECDALMRIYGWLGAAIPCAVLFDFKAAFPMLAQVWMWFLLNVLECPLGLFRTLRGLCRWAAAFSAT